MLAKAPFLLGWEKARKRATLSTKGLSYQQKGRFTPVLLALTPNPYKFVQRVKYLTTINLSTL